MQNFFSIQQYTLQVFVVLLFISIVIFCEFHIFESLFLILLWRLILFIDIHLFNSFYEVAFYYFCENIFIACLYV